MRRSFFFSLALFFTISTGLLFFSSGFVESEDGWLYLNVARNIYYQHEPLGPPNEYATRQNVNMNSIQGADGKWRTTGGLGYSLTLVPAVAAADLYHRMTETPIPTHFPLQTDYVLHLFASMTNAVIGGVFAVVFFQYLLSLGFSKELALTGMLSTLFCTQLFPLTKFAFPHTLFTTLLVTGFWAIRHYVMTRKKHWILLLVLTCGGLSIAYNVTSFLALGGLLLYAILKLYDHQRLRMRQWLSLGLIMIGVVILLAPKILPILKGLQIHPIIIFESVWGLLFSSGKSIFLYSPILILLPMFWHRLSDTTLRREYLAFTALAITYFFFVGQSHLFFPDRGWFGIWYGGAVWGPRYVSSLLPFAMIGVMDIFRTFRPWERRCIFIPLVLVSLGVQLLGVLLPYQIQYRGLPANVFVAGHELTVYDYASFTPRFSPIITMSKELVKRLMELPYTLKHGDYHVALYDGFSMPHYLAPRWIRPFETQGHITFSTPNEEAHTVQLELQALTLQSTASARATLQYNGETVQHLTLSTTSATLATLQTEATAQHWIDISVIPLSTDSTRMAALLSMRIDDTPINIRSLDLPYVDHQTNDIQTPYPRHYYGTVANDPWLLWHHRARIYENTLDLWWIRAIYYWDIPKTLVKALFATITLCFVVAFWQLGRIWKEK